MGKSDRVRESQDTEGEKREREAKEESERARENKTYKEKGKIEWKEKGKSTRRSGSCIPRTILFCLLYINQNQNLMYG